ncbi:hypothetical protein D3C75_823110 [compost metagenome]
MTAFDQKFGGHFSRLHVVRPHHVDPFQPIRARSAHQRHALLRSLFLQTLGRAYAARQHHAVNAVLEQSIKTAHQPLAVATALSQKQHFAVRLQHLAQARGHFRIKRLADITQDQPNHPRLATT